MCVCECARTHTHKAVRPAVRERACACACLCACVSGSLPCRPRLLSRRAPSGRGEESRCRSPARGRRCARCVTPSTTKARSALRILPRAAPGPWPRCVTPSATKPRQQRRRGESPPESGNRGTYTESPAVSVSLPLTSVDGGVGSPMPALRLCSVPSDTAARLRQHQQPIYALARVCNHGHCVCNH